MPLKASAVTAVSFKDSEQKRHAGQWLGTFGKAKLTTALLSRSRVSAFRHDFFLHRLKESN